MAAKLADAMQEAMVDLVAVVVVMEQALVLILEQVVLMEVMVALI